MSTLLWLALAAAIMGAVLSLTVWKAWSSTDEASRRLVRRVGRLPLHAKLRLALAMARDRRIPLLVRFLPPGLVLYLAMPIDIVPDFIPVLGQLDDVLVIVVGVAMLLRFAPRAVLEDQLSRIER